MIQLYDPQTTDFTLNGHVLTDISNDVVTWKMNTTFELSFDYPLFSPHGAQLAKEMIVTVPTPDKFEHDQGFRINSVIKSMGIVTVHAYHLFWDLNQNFIEDINIVGDTGAEAIEHIMTNTQYDHTFRYTSDLVNTANARQVRMSAIKALIGDDDNSFITRFGGQFEWDNFEFNVQSSIGQNRGVVFRNGKNLTGYTFEENIDSVVTRIMPEGYDGLLLPEKYVDADNIGNYLNPRIAVIEYSDIKAIDPDATTTDEDAVPLEEAYEKLRTAAKAEFSDNNLDKPTNTISLNVILLENTEEYKDKGQFTKVYPGDTARFVHTDDNVDTEAQLTGYTWQPSNQEYLTVTFESATKSAPTFSQTISRVTNSVQSIGKDIKLVSANGQNANTYSQHEPTDSDPGVGGEVWYENDGSSVNMWIFTNGHWQEEIHDATGEEIKQSVDAQFQGVTTWQASIDSDLAIVKAKNEQFDASVQSLGTDIATLKSDVTKSVADVGAKADTAIGSASEALTQIGTANSDLKTIKSDMNTVKGTLETVATSEQLDGVNKTATSAKALAETNANSIQNTVTKTELTTAKSEWSSAQSTITAGQISTEITKVNQTITDATKDLVSRTVLNNAIVNSETGTKQVISKSIANISVGGRNLIPNSSTQQVLKRPEDNPSYPSWVGRPIYTGLKNNETYTFSALATAETTDKSAEQWGIRILGKSGAPQVVAKTLAANTGKRQSLTFTTPDDGISYDVWIYAGAMGQDYTPADLKIVVTVLDYKLETGTMATDWSPAPEDMATVTQFTSIDKTLSGVQVTANDAVTQSQYTQLAGQFTSTIAAVASGNLVADSGWTGVTGVTTHAFYTGTASLYYIDNTSETLERTCRSPYFAIKPNTTYTLSFKAFADIKVTDADVFLLTRSSGSNKDYEIANLVISHRKFSASTAEYVTVQVTTGASDNEGYIRFDNNGSTNGMLARLFFTEVQLEEGGIATPYKLSVSAAQSQITQTQSMIDLRVEKSGLLSEINMQAGATIVKSNKLYLDASSVIMGGTAFINAANIKTVSASSITAGTLNASLVNVVNLSASSIVAGVLSGAGIVMNLNTGEVEFQKGRIHSSDNQLYIDMDSKVISTSSTDASAVLKNGELQLTEPNFFDLSDDPYFRLYHGSVGPRIGAVIEGRGGVAIAESGSNLGIINNSGWGKSEFAGIAIRDGETFVGSNAKRLFLRGGNYASIEIGDVFSNTIDRVTLNGKDIYLHSTETWPTTSNSSNMYRAVDGRLLDVTSASKYKIDIKRTHSTGMAEKLIQLPIATWIDKAEQADFENGNTATKPTRNFGMIAEDLDEAGLEELVVKHDGEVEGLQYDRIALTLIPLIKDMKEQIDLLKLKVEELTNAS